MTKRWKQDGLEKTYISYILSRGTSNSEDSPDTGTFCIFMAFTFTRITQIKVASNLGNVKTTHVRVLNLKKIRYKKSYSKIHKKKKPGTFSFTFNLQVKPCLNCANFGFWLR